MSIGQDAVSYAGCVFDTPTQAQWAFFFDTLGESWEYRPDGDWTLQRDRRNHPQFYVFRDLDRDFYLEVRWLLDDRRRFDLQSTGDRVYLAVGAVPDSRQVIRHRWCDERRESGVVNLTVGPPWEEWFPPDDRAVRDALAKAHVHQFPLAMPFGRQGSEEVRGIPPRERQDQERDEE
ncbi:MAG: hypothetical protein ACRDSP_22965 [Pseudonocardiaceae bacterium]